MEQLTNLESKQMRKPQKALNRNNQIYNNNKCLKRITHLKEDSDRQAKLKENCTLQQATNLQSGSIRMAKQTVIITKNETNSMNV